MVTETLLAATLVLIAIHEYLLTRSRSRTKRWARRAVLFTTLISALIFGARADLSALREAVLDAGRPAPTFEPHGDPMLANTLSRQRPQLPIPRNATLYEIRVWQAQVSNVLRMRAGIHAEPPEEVPYEVLQVEDVDTVRRTLISFTSWDGTRIPAYVHAPKVRSTPAAILVIPGHGEGIRATAGILRDYQHSAALEFARRGFLTMTPELRGFGLLGRHGGSMHRVVAESALIAGSFYKAVVGNDLIRALTVLENWEGVDRKRIAIAGASLGGELAVFVGALDPRPKVVISHSYGGAIGPESAPDAGLDSSTQTPHGCHTIPGVNHILYQEDWFSLLAPRAVQIVRGTENFRPSIKELAVTTAQIFDQFGVGERFEVSLVEGGHEFFVEPAAVFLSKWL